jgi:hypothetical protein
VWFVVDKDSKELLSNHLASAISEFKDSTLGGNPLNLDRSELQISSLQSSSVSVNSNRLTKALRDYQLSTVSSALDVINKIGQWDEGALFATPFDGVSDSEKLNSQNPDVFSLNKKSK